MNHLISHPPMLFTASLNTPLGPMTAIASERHLYLLEFIERQGLASEILRLRKNTHATLMEGQAAPLASIQQELEAYFTGRLTKFHTPTLMLGTPFQKRVWQALQEIPYGETRAYGEIARSLGKPTAFRAVAQANGANQLAIIIPCHRVINTGGKLGGYAGGLIRKQWLLDHERTHRLG